MAIDPALANYFPVSGSVRWIGIRPERKQPMRAVTDAELIADHGIGGDHRARTSHPKRQVTLIQYENLPTIQHFLKLPAIEPEMLRRNIVVEGINLLALIGKRFSIGDAVLAGTGECKPCGRMEKTLGDGGYNAVVGYGGINAIVESGGNIAVGDLVSVLDGS